MTREEKQKAINALKISAPVRVMTWEEFNNYVQTINQIMDWLEQETVSKDAYDHEYFLRKEFEIKIDKLQRQLGKIRAEIANYQKEAIYSDDVVMTKRMVLAIIDKYMAESEVENDKKRTRYY